MDLQTILFSFKILVSTYEVIEGYITLAIGFEGGGGACSAA